MKLEDVTHVEEFTSSAVYNAPSEFYPAESSFYFSEVTPDDDRLLELLLDDMFLLNESSRELPFLTSQPQNPLLFGLSQLPLIGSSFVKNGYNKTPFREHGTKIMVDYHKTRFSQRILGPQSNMDQTGIYGAVLLLGRDQHKSLPLGKSSIRMTMPTIGYAHTFENNLGMYLSETPK